MGDVLDVYLKIHLVPLGWRHERRRGLWYVNFRLDRERIRHLGGG